MNVCKINLQSLLKDEQLKNRIVTQLGNLVKDKQKSVFNKKSLKKYLTTFTLEVGSDFATEEEVKILYSYLNPKIFVIQNERQDFHGMIEACLELYVEAKKEPMGGIIKRLILKTRNNTLKQNHREVKEIIDQINQ